MSNLPILIFIQLTSRLCTFTVNQALLSHLSPSHLALSTQLDLYSLSVLFFARESLRVALQRSTSSSAQTVINIAYLAPLIGVPLALVLGQVWANSNGFPNVPFMGESVALYGVASVMELYAEPCFAVAQQKGRYGIRAAAETGATAVKCLVTFAGVVWWQRKTGEVSMVAFAAGQLAYAVMLLVVYLGTVVPMALRESFSLVLTRIERDEKVYAFGYFKHTLLALAFDMYLQSGLKYVLTQGDGLLIAYLASLEDQGAYALASNYGGLIARIVFQPIEESSRNTFAKLCADVKDVEKIQESQPSIDAEVVKQTSSEKKKARKRGQLQAVEPPIVESSMHNSTPPTRNIPEAASVLTRILHLYGILALISCSLGPYIAPRLLSLVVGSKWSSTSASQVLASYTYYIPLLAINGVTEAFVAAVASGLELRQQNVAMGMYSVAFAGAVFTFLRVLDMGAVGLVWANCVNMAGRILWGGWYISRYFKRSVANFDFTATLPGPLSVTAAVAASGILATQRPVLHVFGSRNLDELVWAGCVAGGLVVALLGFERRFLLECYQVARSRT